MNQKFRLQFHEKSCYTCRYYRCHNNTTECLFLGRTLSISNNSWDDRARFCNGWKRRPQTWNYHCENNPHWYDKYISRKTIEKLRLKNESLRS